MFGFFAKIPRAESKKKDDYDDGDKFDDGVGVSDIGPGGDCLIGNEEIADILDDLGDGV